MKSDIKNITFSISQLPQPCIAKYLAVVVDRGMANEVNYFNSFRDAKQVFDEIASDHRLEPETVNKFGYYDVSIWRWTENRYVRLSYTDRLR